MAVMTSRVPGCGDDEEGQTTDVHDVRVGHARAWWLCVPCCWPTAADQRASEGSHRWQYQAEAARRGGVLPPPPTTAAAEAALTAAAEAAGAEAAAATSGGLRLLLLVLRIVIAKTLSMKRKSGTASPRKLKLQNVP